MGKTHINIIRTTISQNHILSYGPMGYDV